jgi:AcrR family transcriptional regulator
MTHATHPRHSDGRDTRWAQHRLSRRVELVEATLRAIRHYGAGVGMDEIAAEAGTSKTVIYRHFGDKASLYEAVVEAVDGLILRDLGNALGRDTNQHIDPRGIFTAVVDSYLRLVERDPEVYRFVVTRPLLDRPVADDPVTGLTNRIADQIATMLAAIMRDQGRDPAPATTWGHALVGLVRASADQWIGEPERIPRAELVQRVTDLAWGGISAALGPIASTERQGWAPAR